jgi:hypothetical protein
MLVAGPGGRFEFFAQVHQKTRAHKKARPDFSGAGCEVQGNLEVLEKLTVVGRFAV